MRAKNKDAKLIISLRLLCYESEILHVHSTTNRDNLSTNIGRQIRS